MQLLVTQFYPVYFYLFPLRFGSSPQRPIFEHLQSVLPYAVCLDSAVKVARLQIYLSIFMQGMLARCVLCWLLQNECRNIIYKVCELEVSIQSVSQHSTCMLLYSIKYYQHSYAGWRLQAAAVVQMGSSFFWAVKQHMLLAVYECFGMTHRSHFQGSSSRRFLLKYF